MTRLMTRFTVEKEKILFSRKLTCSFVLTRFFPVSLTCSVVVICDWITPQEVFVL